MNGYNCVVAKREVGMAGGGSSGAAVAALDHCVNSVGHLGGKDNSSHPVCGRLRDAVEWCLSTPW